MKLFISIISIIFFTDLFAQDQQLIDNTWYIHKLVIDSEDIFPPQVEDNISSTLDVYQDDNGQYLFATGYCDFIYVQMSFEGESSFTLPDGPDVLVGSCSLEESLEFNIAYFGIYYNSPIALNPFAYTITSGTGDDKLLVITNPDGDSAHYGNFMLSGATFKQASLQIYPNPVVDELNIESGASVAVVKIYTADGREVATENLLPEQTKFNVRSLNKGIYILQLTDEEGRVYTSKFIKM